jgi:hypothetical protein
MLSNLSWGVYAVLLTPRPLTRRGDGIVCVYIQYRAVNGIVIVFQISIYRDLVVQGNSRDTTCHTRPGIRTGKKTNGVPLGKSCDFILVSANSLSTQCALSCSHHAW